MSQAGALNPVKAVAALLVLVVVFEYWEANRGRAINSPEIACRDLLGEVLPSDSAGTLSRFAPHDSRNSRPDSDPLTATPQVFRAISYMPLVGSSQIVKQHCQAIYSDRSAAYGADYVEMPAHCLFDSAISSSSRVSPARGAQEESRAAMALKNYCLYMGQDITDAEEVFKIEEVACKRRYDSVLLPSLVNDSCLVRLDKLVPLSIRDDPLAWWQPDYELASTPQEQLKAALGLQKGGGRHNLKSGNIESPASLYLVSHSLDYDASGRRRIVAEGRAIYRHSLEGQIFSPGVLPNNIDTRSGDSGGAVYSYINGEKKLLGIQLAVMSGYSEALSPAARHPSLLLKNYNIAVNPHISSTVVGFPYRYQLQRDDASP